MVVQKRRGWGTNNTRKQYLKKHSVIFFAAENLQPTFLTRKTDRAITTTKSDLKNVAGYMSIIIENNLGALGSMHCFHLTDQNIVTF